MDCAQIECPDLFEPEMPNCVRQFKLDDCCSSMTMCGKYIQVLLFSIIFFKCLLKQ